jgi:hypothetical protein
MRVLREHPGYAVIQNGNAASLLIMPNSDEATYTLRWSIAHLNGHSDGSIVLAEDELLEAFDYHESSDLRMRRSFTTDAPGYFFRLDSYLNIPRRSDGKEGNGNLSIYLTEEISEAVSKLTWKF